MYIYTCVFCRYEKLEAEATAGEERFEEIMGKWSAGSGLNIPQVRRRKEAFSSLHANQNIYM